MKNLKLILSSIIALGVVSTLIVPSFADTIGDSQQTYLNGDINFDGKVGSVDLLILKKMVLGIIPNQEMYVDDGAIKVIEDVQPVIKNISNAQITDINEEENTITILELVEVDGVSEWQEVVLYITENTEFYGVNSLSELGNYSVDIQYDDNTKVIDYIESVENTTCAAKPVIYLYPTEETEVNVSLDIKNGNLTCIYPKYENSWSVTAKPDGTLYDQDGNEYYCLYWEANQNIEYDMSKGFVVKGEDTAEFLREKLLYMGLTPKEANEFIIYWLPKMEVNSYNLITFQDDEYTDNAVLNITPKPDSLLRIFMVYQPLDQPIQIEEQELSTFERDGFTVVEWVGTELN